MLLGAVTYNVLKDLDLDTILTKLEAAGYSAVELRTGHAHGVEPSLDAAGRERVKQRFARSKVRLLSFGSTCEFQSPDAEERRKQIEIGKQWVDLAHDTGAWGVKVRPNGLPKGVPEETTIRNIGASLRELGNFAQGKGVEIWMEVHGRETQVPTVAAAIMKATGHENVGLCWNSNATDVVNGSVKQNFDLLKKHIRNCHINELSTGYPYRELFALMRQNNYERYTLCEVAESKEPDRYLRNYRAFWTELSRPCA
jgi:sugar phosphate isomerase/epimerase